MQALPHHYRASASGAHDGAVATSSGTLAALETNAPPEFGGPEGYWSPETLLVAAIADCFVLSFRSVARASKLDWVHLECDAEGVLDRVEGQNRFTQVTVKPVLTIHSEGDRDKALRCLDKAERVCLVTNSLSAARELAAEVKIADTA